jgi:hypothetical protein
MSLFFTNLRVGYDLSVRKLGPEQFRIKFDCHAGPGLGDGGVWEVQFKPDVQAIMISKVDMWILM